MPADPRSSPCAGPVDVEGYEWVIVTSPNGARELVSGARAATLPKIAAVGPGTAETLRELGVEPAFVPAVSSQDGLLPSSRGRRAASSLPPRRARAGGRSRSSAPTSSPLYRTHLVRPAAPPEGDVVVLASGSAARSFAELGTRHSRRLDRPADDAGSAGGRPQVVAEAATHDLDGLIAAVGGLASPDVFVTFLTDFGLEDDFVGTCHGVMKRIAPEVEIIDITHGIQPQGVLQGALVLANTLPYLPGRRSPRGRRSVRRHRAARACTALGGRASLRRARQRAADPGRGEARRDRRGPRGDESRVRARARLGDVPRPRCFLSGSGASCEAASRSRSSARRSSRARSRSSTCRSPTSTTGGFARAASTSTGSGTCS